VTPVLKHIHKLKKHTYAKSKSKVYFCTLPDCNYKADVGLVVGKTVLCNVCNEPFTINESHLKLLRPHCNNCGKKKVKGIDGKAHYVNKRLPDERILEIMATESTNNLRSRMSIITSHATNTVTEDDLI